MIYLKNTQSPQVLYVPRDGNAAAEPLALTIESTIEHNRHELTVEDLRSSDRYVDLAVELPGNLRCGEYQYTLKSGAEVVSSGLLYIVDIARPTNEFEIDEEIKQYEL